MNITPPLMQPLATTQGGLPVWEKNVSASSSAPAAQPAGDMVSISSRNTARLLEDDEVQSVLNDTMQMISGNGYDAMQAHGVLDPSRVASLLS